MVHAAILVWASACFLGADPLLAVDLADGWTQKTQGAWRMRYDHRDLLVMRHPWEESHKGDFASAVREVAVPGDWQGPVFLQFYCTDDYHTDAWRPDGSWLTAEGFIGHRMKQALVDDHVVWSADVSDPVFKVTPPPFRVELPVKPGQRFVLTLLAFDVVASTTALDKGFYQSANNETPREADPNASRFQTHVYWGDLYLCLGDAQPRAGSRPSEKRVRAVHTQRWPLPPFGDPWPGPIMLEVCAPAGIPKPGFPVRSGVPIPAGKAKAVAGVRLRGKEGKGVAAQRTELGKWPDDSIQWVLFDFPATLNSDCVELAFGREAASFSGKVRAKEEGEAIRVDAGIIQYAVKPGDAVRDIKLRGSVKVAALGLSVEVEGETAPGTIESVSVIEHGPFRHTVEMDGRFDSLERSLGSFRLYCSSYLNLPYLTFAYRLFNDTVAPLPVAGLKLRFTLAAEPAGLRVPGTEVKDGFVLRQSSEQARQLDGASVDPVAPMYVAWKDGAVTVRQFRELYPKEATVKGKEVVIDLIAGGKTPVVFTPGEAKSHEVWLALGTIDAAQFAATVAAPPILQNAAYFCSTGAFGPARPHAGVPVLHEHMTNDFGKKQWEDFGQQFGVRDFPDSAYYGGLPKWCNNYYERMLGLWSEWFMSGDRAWYDLASDVCRHLMDVAIVHSEVPEKSWLAAIHGPGENHVSGPWNPTLRIVGLSLYQKLTGDLDAREAFMGVADYCVRTHAGMDSPSVRDHAGPFDAICTAYQETGDTKYLDDGAARLAAVIGVMDMRRGVWAETHGSMVYRGNVPWMAAQLGRPLYLWYRATGDLQAAQALVGLAESIVCENTDWDKPGAVSGYSHNPHFAMSASYDLLILPVIFAAYELTEDSFFLDAAKAQWERWTREKAFDSPLNCHWNTPWLVWCLKKYDLVPGG